MKNVAWKQVPGPFNFQKIHCKQESEEVCMLIWTNFDSFAITYLTLIACFENFVFH